jgi:hypothetical protein
MNDHPTSIRIPPEVKEWLRERAEANCRTVNGEILALLKASKIADAQKEAA